MARGLTGGYKTVDDYVLAVVHNQYDSDGNKVDDSDGFTGVDTVDVVLLGFSGSMRRGVAKASSEADAETNEFFELETTT